MSQWEQLQQEAFRSHEAHSALLARHREELERVSSHFGPQAAMNFAWSELEVPHFAFLVEFGLNVFHVSVDFRKPFLGVVNVLAALRRQFFLLIVRITRWLVGGTFTGAASTKT